MKQFKIKDNCLKKKEDFYMVSGLVEQVADKTLQQLECEGIFIFPEAVKVSEDITKDQMVLQSVNDKYRSGNVMGFIGMGDEIFTIESRFSNGKEDYFFQYLLERVLEVPNIVNLDTEANQNNKLYNLLMFLFPHYLRAAMRKGLYKAYIRKEYNDGNVRGTIDVARHIKKNIPFTGKIAYYQREYNYDNYLMELVRHTIEYMKSKSYGNKLMNTIKDEANLVIEATPEYNASDRKRIIEANQRNVVRHAFYHEYRALQQLCILILRNEKHQIGLGTKRIYGILFDGAWLWEEYINLLIGEMFFHPMNKGGQGAQWLFVGNTGLIYPDFISKNQNERIIADAKYKPIENIGNKDYLQVLAYMLRFDAKQGYYLYPENQNRNSLELRVNSGVSFEKNIIPREDMKVIKHGLLIPDKVSNYEEFVQSIRQSEKKFVEYFGFNYNSMDFIKER